MKDYKRLTKKVSSTFYDIKCSNCNAIYPQKDEVPNFCENDGCYFVLKQRLGELEDKIEQGLLVELPTKAKIRKEAVIEFAKRYKEQVKNYTGKFTDNGFMVSLEAMIRAVDFVFRQMFGDEVVQQ